MEQSLDLGGSISVSPSYTFYYSWETGLNYIKNVQITRIYGDLMIGRRSISYIIIESNKKEIIKIKGAVNYFQMRMAYDQFCPHVLIGEKGREMGLEQLCLHYHVRRRVLHVITITTLSWFFISFLCQYLDSRSSLIIMTLVSIVVLLVSILAVRVMIKTNAV